MVGTTTVTTRWDKCGGAPRGPVSAMLPRLKFLFSRGPPSARSSQIRPHPVTVSHLSSVAFLPLPPTLADAEKRCVTARSPARQRCLSIQDGGPRAVALVCLLATPSDVGSAPGRARFSPSRSFSRTFSSPKMLPWERSERSPPAAGEVPRPRRTCCDAPYAPRALLPSRFFLLVVSRSSLAFPNPIQSNCTNKTVTPQSEVRLSRSHPDLYDTPRTLIGAFRLRFYTPPPSPPPTSTRRAAVPRGREVDALFRKADGGGGRTRTCRRFAPDTRASRGSLSPRAGQRVRPIRARVALQRRDSILSRNFEQLRVARQRGCESMGRSSRGRIRLVFTFGSRRISVVQKVSSGQSISTCGFPVVLRSSEENLRPSKLLTIPYYDWFLYLDLTGS